VTDGAQNSEQRVGMMLDAHGALGVESLEQLRATLGGGTVSEPDGTGVFEVVVSAPSFEAALEQVWNAVAAGGLDDRLRFVEHPNLPQHWRHLAGHPSPADG
jgi:hypothetical protein